MRMIPIHHKQPNKIVHITITNEINIIIMYVLMPFIALFLWHVGLHKTLLVICIVLTIIMIKAELFNK